MLNQEYVTDPNTGRPTTNIQTQPNQQPIMYDLTKEKYGVAVSVGKSYPTRIAQGRDQMTELLAADPTLMPILGDIFFKYSDAPWSYEAEKRMKKVIEGAHPEFFKAEKPGTESPEQLRAQLQASQQQIQQLQQQLEMAAKAIEMDAEKQKAMLEKANIDAQVKLQSEQSRSDSDEMLAQMDGRLQVLIEKIQIDSEEKIAELKEAAETERMMMQQRFDALQAQLDRQAAEKMAVRQAEVARENAESVQAHEAGMAGAERDNQGDE